MLARIWLDAGLQITWAEDPASVWQDYEGWFCARAQDWPWSSAAAHLAASDDALVSVRPLLELVPNWAAFIGEDDR